MTQTPTPYFATRPDPPQPNTDEYARWSKESALSYPGGSLSAAYGNLIQTLNVAGDLDACNVNSINVSVSASNPVLKIGGTPITRKAYTYTKKQYNKRNSSLAAAGMPVTIVTDIGSYQARMTGSVQAFAEYICRNSGLLYGTVYMYTDRGAQYGPYNPVPTT